MNFYLLLNVRDQRILRCCRTGQGTTEDKEGSKTKKKKNAHDKVIGGGGKEDYSKGMRDPILKIIMLNVSSMFKRTS
jgi:hypothetical protein